MGTSERKHITSTQKQMIKKQDIHFQNKSKLFPSDNKSADLASACEMGGYCFAGQFVCKASSLRKASLGLDKASSRLA